MVQSNSCKKKKESCATTESVKSIYWLPWQQKYAIASEKYLSVIIVSIEDIVSQTSDIRLIVANISVI